jgi:hypothetical protein
MNLVELQGPVAATFPKKTNVLGPLNYTNNYRN